MVRRSDFIRSISGLAVSIIDFIIFPSSLLVSGLERNQSKNISIARLIIQTMMLNQSILKNTSTILLWTNFLDSRKVSRLPDPSESI